MTLSNDEFKAAIHAYLRTHDLQTTELAVQLGKPRGTVQGWHRKGIKLDSARQHVIERYPELFSSSVDTSPNAAPSAQSNSTITVVKIELAKFAITTLTPILDWFLFQASPAERNLFRDQLGDSWKRFLELTRAMTGETAFAVAKQEGRLRPDAEPS